MDANEVHRRRQYKTLGLGWSRPPHTLCTLRLRVVKRILNLKSFEVGVVATTSYPLYFEVGGGQTHLKPKELWGWGGQTHLKPKVSLPRFCGQRESTCLEREKVMKTYSEEFKKEAVRLVGVSEKPIAHLARELGVSKSVLFKWRSLYSDRGECTLTMEQEVHSLRQRVRVLEMEREILKKATAFFANQSR